MDPTEVYMIVSELKRRLRKHAVDLIEVIVDIRRWKPMRKISGQ